MLGLWRILLYNILNLIIFLRLVMFSHLLVIKCIGA